MKKYCLSILVVLMCVSGGFADLDSDLINVCANGNISEVALLLESGAE